MPEKHMEMEGVQHSKIILEKKKKLEDSQFPIPYYYKAKLKECGTYIRTDIQTNEIDLRV